MTSRERIMVTFNHVEPDRVPIDIGTCDTTIARDVYVELADLLKTEPKAARTARHPNAFVIPDERTLQLH